MVIAIVGNNCDLEDKREVERETAKAYADNIDAIFVETSAKTGDNVQEMFTDISRRLPAISQQANPNVIIHSDAGQKKYFCSSKKCC